MDIKICPMCQAENAADAVLCQKCFAAIRSVPVTRKEKTVPIFPSQHSSDVAGNKNSFSMSFSCNGFVFNHEDLEDIVRSIYTSSEYLKEYSSLVEKINIVYDQHNMEINACAGWQDPINEINPYIVIYEGMIAKTIPIAAMYLRGMRGVDLINWIKVYSQGTGVFDGKIPPEARMLGKAMLAETLAHETAHIIKKHLQTLVRYSHSNEEQYYELMRNLERDADMTAIMIIETTPLCEFYFLGALLHSLVIYINGYRMFDYDGSSSHPADKERLLNLLMHSLDMLLEAGVDKDELNVYCNLAGISLV